MLIIKLFLFNPDFVFDITEVGERSKVSRGLARREVGTLLRAGFLKTKSYSKETLKQKNRKIPIASQ